MLPNITHSFRYALLCLNLDSGDFMLPALYSETGYSEAKPARSRAFSSRRQHRAWKRILINFNSRLTARWNEMEKLMRNRSFTTISLTPRGKNIARPFLKAGREDFLERSFSRARNRVAKPLRASHRCQFFLSRDMTPPKAALYTTSAGQIDRDIDAGRPQKDSMRREELDRQQQHGKCAKNLQRKQCGSAVPRKPNATCTRRRRLKSAKWKLTRREREREETEKETEISSLWIRSYSYGRSKIPRNSKAT